MNKNKNKNYILIAVGVVAVLGILLWLGKTKVNERQGSADLSAVFNSASESGEDFYDFGTIRMAAGPVKHDFKIKNTTNEPIKVEKLYTSCMCTTAEFIQNGENTGPFGMPGHDFVPPLRKTIAAGEEVVISVTFDPAAHGPAGIGPIGREIYLEGASGFLETLSFEAKVTP